MDATVLAAQTTLQFRNMYDTLDSDADADCMFVHFKSIKLTSAVAVHACSEGADCLYIYMYVFVCLNVSLDKHIN